MIIENYKIVNHLNRINKGSYKHVGTFGDTVPGFGGGSADPGDVYRYGNYQSPMYGTYAAKAFLASNVAPLTYVRLLGQEHTNATTAGKAGWATAKFTTSDGTGAKDGDAGATGTGGGGAYGIFIGASGSGTPFTGTLAAIVYSNSGSIRMSGTLARDLTTDTSSAGALVNSDANGNFKLVVSSSQLGMWKTIEFNLNDQSENFIRKKLNTNPQLTYEGAFYPTSSESDYWLGESFEHSMTSASLATSKTLQGVVVALAKSGSSAAPSTSVTPAYQKASSREAVAGWFIGQDLGPPGLFDAANCQRLFRLKGRGHGSWLHKNTKVSISNIRRSNNPSATDYGTFSVLIRHINDTDNNVQIIERFDLCNLDPTSPDFIARKIGDRYQAWSTSEKRLKEYGDYPNLSNYVYVEMNSEVEAGATDPTLLPFGYYAPPKMKNVDHISYNSGSAGEKGQGTLSDKLIVTGGELQAFATSSVSHAAIVTSSVSAIAGGAATAVCQINLAMGLHVPAAPVRLSASDGGLSDLGDAYFGFRTTRGADSTNPAAGMGDYHNLLYAGFPDDPTFVDPTGVDGYAYIFSLNDIDKGKGSTNAAYYASGSRRASAGARNYSVANLLDQGYDKFTAPFWGGADGFDITKPDPLYNGAMNDSSTQESSYVYNTWRRAIDTISDPEFVNMNLLVAPGLTHDGLTKKMINTCEERGDALAIIDLPDIYIPPHEYYVANKYNRIPNSVISNVNTFRDRRIDSSYGCTFYPWVQTRDENTGISLWAPPSVAMLGVLGSSQAKSDVWFAPAGFNRGGLSDGAAGIPITAVSQRLTSEDRDNLYVQNINPIASFPSTGLVVFGQKTTQQKQSALDRINVRRLVIYLKKQISIISNEILFEQNVEATWNRFKGLVEPFLANVKVQFGITDYKLILDESTTTPDLIDQNILYAKIMVKPARAIEFIAIDFVIASSGASFDD